MSKVFNQVTEVMAVKYQVSSTYHPESQGEQLMADYPPNGNVLD